MSFAYTNTTTSGKTLSPKALGVKTNYALVADEPNMVRINNTTASMEQPELITYRSEAIKRVSTAIAVRNPAPIQTGVQYTVKLETVDRDSSGSSPIDEPICAWLTIKHPASNTWNNAKVSEIVVRLLSACLKNQSSSASGSVASTDWRFEDLMRSALAPTID